MINIGTSGFSFADWRGTVYPKNMKLRDALCYYQDDLGFDCVEINSTYYTLVSARSFAGMEEKTHAGFQFVVKAFRGITHDPFDHRLKDKKPSLKQAFENIEKFVYSLQPLAEKGKLGAVLLQFPVFFYPSPESHEYILECRRRFGKLPLVVEFRNNAWAKPPVFSFLKKEQIGYCAVAEPHLPRLMPFIDAVTSSVAYLRFHGRNTHWFNTPVDERYNYLYSEEELQEWVPKIAAIDNGVSDTYLFFNNHYKGKAADNARAYARMLGLTINELRNPRQLTLDDLVL
jgi:uncharacterized protein YecE (DUF72 family)